MHTLTVTFLINFPQNWHKRKNPQKEKWVRSGSSCTVSMHNLVNTKLLDAKLLVYAKDTHGFTNYHTDVVNVWGAILAKSGHYLDFLSLFRLSNRFKSAYNKATLKSLFVLNSTAPSKIEPTRLRMSKSTGVDLLGSTPRSNSTCNSCLPTWAKITLLAFSMISPPPRKC